jgi:hypothetical protein
MRTALRGVLLAAVLSAPSATGGPAEAQSITFTLGPGTLSIVEPGTASLTAGTVASLAGSSFTGSLGSTTVSDQRGGVLGWTTTIAQTTAFSNGTTTLPVGSTKAWVAAPIVPTNGVATVSAGTYVSQLTGLVLSSSAQAFVSATAVVGVNTTSFNPSFAITIPSNATAGSYSGVITQTVS